MKHNVILITLSAVALLAAACEKPQTEREKMDSRIPVDLEVTYAVEGEATEALYYTHEYALHTLEVNLNNEDLHWDLESNRDWCKVVPAQHVGSGEVTLQLEANEDFDGRETATLTFTAGAFRGFTITVDQTGSAFILSQPYFVSGVAGGEYQLEVTTLSDTEWDFESQEEWLEVTEISSAPSGEDRTTTTLRLTAAANLDDSRLATVALIAGAEKDAFRLWQFGNELEWVEGSIFFPKEAPATFSIVVPKAQIRAVDKPDYATESVEDLDEILSKLTYSLAENLSDCAAPRDVPFSIILSNNTSTVVPLPSMKQDYTPAGGLLTKEGMKLFAQRVAAGEPTTDWEEEGWVTVKGDIDMSGVTDWAGIGTVEHPFSGQFDGGGYAISKLSASTGLFNVVAGADEANPVIIKSITLANNCNIYSDVEDWEGEACLGGIVNRAEFAQIRECAFLGNLDLSGSAADDGDAYVGGILGKGGEGTGLYNCRVADGLLSVSTSAGDAFLGGIAGTATSLRGCDMSSTLQNKASSTRVILGGITSQIGSANTVLGNRFGGTITLASTAKTQYVGGLYGTVLKDSELVFDAAEDMSSSSGTIRLDSYLGTTTTVLFLGGHIGYAAGGTSLTFKGYTPFVKFQLDQTVYNVAKMVCVGGILGGSDLTDAMTKATFENIVPQGSIAFKFDTANKVASGILQGFYGGVVGLVYGPADFTDCINKSPVGALLSDSGVQAGAKNDNSINAAGGIAGYIEGGNATFTSCQSEAKVFNRFYINRSAYNVDPNYLKNFYGAYCGGILGAFDAHKTVGNKTLTITSCAVTATVEALRGIVGGIVGYCQNATISSCSFGAKLATELGNQIGCHQGGIVGGITKGQVSECEVKADIHAGCPGSSDFASPGGIVGRVIPGDPVTVNACKYKGVVSCCPSSGTTLYPGGLVGAGCDNTVVKDCRLGGTLEKWNKNYTARTEAKDITENNVRDCVYGNATGTLEGDILLWMGD